MSFEILESISSMTALDLDLKNSPSIETALYPDLEIVCASLLVLARITLPNRNFAIGRYFLSHFMWSDKVPNTPEIFGSFNWNSGIAFSGMILSFGRFLSLATWARLTKVSKSGTTIAFIQSELAASIARSYCLSQDNISYTIPSMPSFFVSSLSWEIV